MTSLSCALVIQPWRCDSAACWHTLTDRMAARRRYIFKSLGVLADVSCRPGSGSPTYGRNALGSRLQRAGPWLPVFALLPF